MKNNQILFLMVLCSMPMIQAMDTPDQNDLRLLNAAKLGNVTQVKSILEQAVGLPENVKDLDLYAALKAQVKEYNSGLAGLLCIRELAKSHRGFNEIYRHQMLRPYLNHHCFTSVPTNPTVRALVNARDGDNRTALLCIPVDKVMEYGVEQNSIGICKMLIAAGADVNARGNNGSTLFMAAAELERPEICKYLLAFGAYIDAQDAEGFTPLIKGAMAGSRPMVQLLLRHGANPAILPCAIPGYTAAAHLAEQAGHADLALLLNDPMQIQALHGTTNGLDYADLF